MTLEEGLRAYLLTQPAVTAIIGTRLYPDTLPEKVTLPAVTAQRISTTRAYAHSGASSYRTARVQLTFTASTRAGARQAADAVLGALSGKRLVGVTVGAVLVVAERDDYDAESGRYRVLADVLASFTGD